MRPERTPSAAALRADLLPRAKAWLVATLPKHHTHVNRARSISAQRYRACHPTCIWSRHVCFVAIAKSNWQKCLSVNLETASRHACIARHCHSLTFDLPACLLAAAAPLISACETQRIARVNSSAKKCTGVR